MQYPPGYNTGASYHPPKPLPCNVIATRVRDNPCGRRAGLKIRSPQGGVGSSPTFGTPTQRSAPTRRKASQSLDSQGKAFHPRLNRRVDHHAATRTETYPCAHQLLPYLLPNCYRICYQPTPPCGRSWPPGIGCPRPSAPASWRWSRPLQRDREPFGHLGEGGRERRGEGPLGTFTLCSSASVPCPGNGSPATRVTLKAI